MTSSGHRPWEQRLRLSLQLSKQMLAAGQAGDWDEVAKLDLERRSLLTDSTDSDLPQAGPAIAELLQEIIDINTHLTNLATAAKNASAEELTRAQLGRRVVSAYQAVSK